MLDILDIKYIDFRENIKILKNYSKPNFHVLNYFLLDSDEALEIAKKLEKDLNL